ncbi:MAG: hypothetical protein K0U86_18800 [Planctomycetes bacterium]|nr:hypothetical protein [Planctomycetota bacterium]MCH9726958.1 hypothetical protein [Planctomycetota bacterium]MCH9776629.1 hypothetical protein [Planctomycetota bacterium]MCH9790764.1 hypothetical protein [Planctomycetota bacterium]
MRKLLFLLICCCLLFVLGTNQQDSQFAHAVDPAKSKSISQDDANGEKKLSKFMREKLTNSQLVLEGLMVEDYDLMQKGAKKMIQMSNATEWQVIEGPIFARQSEEFRSAAKQVIKFAKEKNIDGASLSYLHLTMTCISCHKKVNKVLISESGTKLPLNFAALKKGHTK